MFPSLLATSLLALMFASPILGAPSSRNDPFRNIALRAPTQPEPPVCCLRPLEPAEPTGDEVFISFEDWKARWLSEAREQPLGTPQSTNKVRKPSGVTEGTEPTGPDSMSLLNEVSGTAQGAGQQDSVDTSQHDERLAPHFRIPVVDRFNYASTDCSAHVHTAHHSAKSPSSILSSKKDRYMLSPCAEKKQFVIVELCDDIMIDTVQLANYEFFSGVFKDFSVSVAKTPPTDDEGWIHAGTYRAQNVRGVQSFHPPPTLRDFYRFIRIDFHSHYGNEYYCPLSLLRVYGLTHLEQWKWDEWESQSKARRAVEDASAAAEGLPEPPRTAHVPVVDLPKPEPVDTQAVGKGDAQWTTETDRAGEEERVASATSEPDGPTPVGSDPVEETKPTQEASTVSTAVDSSASITHLEIATPASFTTPDDLHDESHVPQTAHLSDSNSTTTTSSLLQTSVPPSDPLSVSLASLSTYEGTILSNGTHAAQSSRVTSTASNLSSSISSSISLAAQSHSHPPMPAVPPVTTGGESIYRTIMNRLTALEGNTTLYARYVEEQTAGIREVLLRMGEDLGRLEGISKAQGQMYQRSVTEFDKQRKKLEQEHNELLARVNHLTDEVVLEKRLGILQLLLLLAVLVFMTLTRGSRGEHASVHRVPGVGRPLGMREWGRRTLSLSGDWVNRFRSRSPTPKAVARPEPRQPEKGEEKGDFPSRSTQTPSHRPFLSSSPRSLNPRSATRHLSSRPRTPSSLRVSTPRHHNLHARSSHAVSSPPPSARPQMTRSTSIGFGSSGFGTTLVSPVPKSAKRWARSAHLHEVKSTNRTSDSSRAESEKPPDSPREESASPSRSALASEGATPSVDVFSPRPESVPTPAASKGKSKQSRPTLSPLRLSASSDLPRMCVVSGPTSDAEGSEGDAWVDTDADGSESELGMGPTDITPSPSRHAIPVV